MLVHSVGLWLPPVCPGNWGKPTERFSSEGPQATSSITKLSSKHLCRFIVQGPIQSSVLNIYLGPVAEVHPASHPPGQPTWQLGAAESLPCSIKLRVSKRADPGVQVQPFPLSTRNQIPEVTEILKGRCSRTQLYVLHRRNAPSFTHL